MGTTVQINPRLDRETGWVPEHEVTVDEFTNVRFVFSDNHHIDIRANRLHDHCIEVTSSGTRGGALLVRPWVTNVIHVQIDPDDR